MRTSLSKVGWWMLDGRVSSGRFQGLRKSHVVEKTIRPLLIVLVGGAFVVLSQQGRVGGSAKSSIPIAFDLRSAAEYRRLHTPLSYRRRVCRVPVWMGASRP